MRIERATGDNLYHQNKARQTGLARIQEKLATGRRINRASDDAAGLAVATEMDKFVRGYQVAAENINAGISAMRISDGAGSVIGDMLQRQRELAMQSGNGTLNDDQRGALDKEYQALSQEIDRIAQSTEFNGQKLSNGQGPLADGTGKVQAGGRDSDQIEITASDMRASTLGVGPADIRSSQTAVQALSALDDAMRRVNSDRAERGANINRMEYSSQNNENQKVNGTRALSAILDLDYAQGTTDRMRESILADANNAAISQFNRISRTHLLALLGG